MGFLALRTSGTPNMAPALVQWFVFAVVISIFAAYLASRTLSAGTQYLRVFRVVGTIGFLGYAGRSACSHLDGKALALGGKGARR